MAISRREQLYRDGQFYQRGHSYQQYQFYLHYLLRCSSRWFAWVSPEHRLALLQQVTQWHTHEMSEDEYRHWL